MNQLEDRDMVWGWTQRQYEVAWTYFRDFKVTLDKQLAHDAQDESLVRELAELQSLWLSTFPCDPCKGPMQLYTPEVSLVKRNALRQIWDRLTIHYLRSY